MVIWWHFGCNFVLMFVCSRALTTCNQSADIVYVLWWLIIHQYNVKINRIANLSMSFFSGVYFGECRFDCGSGTGKVRSDTPIILNQWNTLTVYRYRWDAWIQLNSGQRIQGRSKVMDCFSETICFQIHLSSHDLWQKHVKISKIQNDCANKRPHTLDKQLNGVRLN